MKFPVAVLYEKLYNKRPFCENHLSDCHTFMVRRFILLCIKHQTNTTNCYISRTEPLEVEKENLRTANNSQCRWKFFYVFKL